MEYNDNEKYAAIGRRIKQAREKEGLTQSELAKKLGYNSPTYVSLIEDGKRKIRIDDLDYLSKLLHQELDYLINGETKSKTTISMALRSDKSLDSDDVNKVENLIEALKIMKKKPGGRS